MRISILILMLTICSLTHAGLTEPSGKTSGAETNSPSLSLKLGVVDERYAEACLKKCMAKAPDPLESVAICMQNCRRDPGAYDVLNIKSSDLKLLIRDFDGCLKEHRSREACANSAVFQMQRRNGTADLNRAQNQSASADR